MMKTVIGSLIAAAFFATLGGSCFAQDRSGVTSQQGPKDAAATKAVDDYWTEERMRNAQPMDLPSLTPEDHEKLLKMPVPETKEAPIVVEPSSMDLMEGEAPAPTALGQPAKANVKQRPFWNGGKLFFTKDTGGNYSCSAEFVGSKRVIMTAAHCVMNGATGKWYKNFKFARAYDNGGGQKVGWECMSVKTAWHTSGPNYPYDYAFIYASKDSGAGWLGLKTAIPYSQFWSIGYPSNYGGGKRMYKVEGTKGQVGGGTVAMNDNPFGKGSSGGAWIGDLTIPHVGGNYAIGLNSYYVGSPDPMYGPYFNATTFGLYTHVRDKKCMN